MADFQFFLNRQGPRGPQGYKGDKGDDGKTPVPRTGTNTPIETTVIFDTGDGNPYETPNLKYPIEDRGGNIVMLDRTNSTQYYGTPDQATDDSYGVVKLVTPESVLDDPLDSDVITYELFDNNNQAIKTTTDSLAGDITQLNTDLGAEVINRTNADAQLTNKINTDISDEAAARSNADTALSGRIDNLTTSKADKSDVYTKTQTDSLLNNKSNVGHTHNYNDLTNKPDIGNGTITFKQGNTTIGTITTNQLSNSTLIFADPTGVTPGTGLDFDSSTNTLSVKIDNYTLGINSDGEIEVQNAGTTYSEGNAIDLTNDTISVKYDNNTLKLNGSGELYADIPAANDATITITQGGVTKGTFTTNQSINGTIALDAGPDMSSYYTKSQTDNLLNEKIDNDIVQYPLEYLPDTTDSITLHNMDSNYSGIVVNDPYVTFNPEVGDVQPYFEINLLNGINIVTSVALQPYLHGYVSGLKDYTKIIKLGYYDERAFIPVCMVYPAEGYNSSTLKMFTGNKNSYSIASGGSPGRYKYVSYDNTSGAFALFSCSSNSGEGSWGSKAIVSEEDKLELNKVTVARFTGVVESSSAVGGTVYYNIIPGGITVTPNVYNPSKDTYPFYSLNNASNDTRALLGAFLADSSKDNLLAGVHPASLSLKYDSTTLGVNASNELTVPTATTSSLGLVKPDGNTITINNGVISAASSTPSNMVTTNTSQTVTGQKTFNTDCLKTKNILFNESGYSYGLRISSGTLKYGQTSGDYSYMETSSIGVEASSYKHQLAANGLWSGTGTNNAYTQRIGLSGSGYSYLANNQGRKFYNPTYSSATSSFTPDASTPFFMTSDLLDGTTIQYNGTSGKVEVIGGGSSYTLPTASTSTLGGVKIDGTTITIDGNGVISSAGGSTPSNMVTTDTDQDITGTKQFVNKGIRFFDASGSYSSHVITVGWGEVQVGWNSHNMTWNTNSSSHQFSNGTQNVLYSYGTSTSAAGVVFGGGWRLYRCNSAQNAYYGPDQTTYPYIPYLDSEMLDGTYLKWDSSTKKITVDIQAIKDAIDALSNSSGNASQGPGLNPGGWD